MPCTRARPAEFGRQIGDLDMGEEERVKPPPLSEEEFEYLWMRRNFKEIVKASATGGDPLRYRRIVMEGKVAAAQYDMVRWTKIAVLAAIVTSILSLVATVILALTQNS
jgi:hypothetical protein